VGRQIHPSKENARENDQSDPDHRDRHRHAVRLSRERVPASETPLLVEHISAYSERDGEQRFELALGWLLDGIERGVPDSGTDG
jgi:hypothetical protein